MKLKPHNPIGSIQEQAGYWVLTKHSPDWNADSETELQTWLAQSEAHRQQYQRAIKLWQKLDQLKSTSFPARQTAQNLRAKHLQRRQHVLAAKRAVGQGALILMIAIGLNQYIATDNYHTAIGQRQALTLADGSEVMLNTDTEINVKFTNNRRLVNIEHGEAYFVVTHDTARPFDVVTGNSRIHDIGTRFNVYAQQDMTYVTVAEGEVAVIHDPQITQMPWLDHLISKVHRWLPLTTEYDEASARHLIAGQQIAYNDLGTSTDLIDVDVNKVSAWRSGRLIFEMAPLEEVLNQLQRYHQVNFQYSAKAIKQIMVSASFEIDNLPKILNTLQATFPIKIQQFQDGKILVSSVKGVAA
jgi:transmembrane sensor